VAGASGGGAAGVQGGGAVGGAEGGGALPRPDLPARLTVATYNVQNLFDLVDDPATDEGEFTPSGLWSAEVFAVRVDALARVIEVIDADVLVLQEVESEAALTALADRLRARGGPDYPHLAVSPTRDPRGIRLAVMSRVPFDRAIGRPINEAISCASGEALDGSRPEARPIYEISLWGVGDEAALTLLVNHWKSKASPSVPCTVEEHHRRGAAQLRGLVSEWLAARSDRAVVVLGDLNAQESESALVDVLGSEVRRDALRFPEDLYNLWGELGVGAGGSDNATNSSYYYDGQWRRLDHIMVTRPMVEGRGWWGVESFEQVRPAFVMSNGRPFSWSLERREGFSDHFALKVSLRSR
jgi:endonuclease/exonuclease/phosphatase family metal-dependent hydrolase